jgi:DNA-binding LytR/AlgR family response regulator
MDINKYLKQSYPLPNQNWKTAAVIGVAISLLMLFMQPFGMSSFNFPNKTFFLLGYGLVTFLVLSINLLFIIKLFSESKWNIKRQILWSCWVVFSLGLANYAYAHFFGNLFSFGFSTLIIFQVYTFFIAIVPITFLILIRQNRLLRTNEAGARTLSERLQPEKQQSEKNELISIIADNGKDQISIAINDLAFIESVGNYIHIYYNLNGELNQRLLRSSISKAKLELKNHKTLLKCHRAFIVNLNFIESIKGNAQGYRLTIKNCDKEVYVSRQYTKVLKEAFVQHN